jgi:hypothetical protein
MAINRAVGTWDFWKQEGDVGEDNGVLLCMLIRMYPGGGKMYIHRCNGPFAASQMVHSDQDAALLLCPVQSPSLRRRPRIRPHRQSIFRRRLSPTLIFELRGQVSQPAAAGAQKSSDLDRIPVVPKTVLGVTMVHLPSGNVLRNHKPETTGNVCRSGKTTEYWFARECNVEASTCGR